MKASWMGILRCACVALGLAVGHQVAQAAVVVEVDMDRDLAGVQDTVSASAGTTVKAALVMTADGGGVSIYSISADFDTSELVAPVVATELLPIDFDSNLTAGVGSVNTGLGRIREIEAEALAAGGPVSKTFEIAHIDFTVAAGGPVDDGLADLTLGLFSINDGVGDNGFFSVTPTFKNGFLVPEPSTMVGLMVGGALVTGRRRGRRA